MNVILKEYTPNPDLLCGMAAAICYDAKDPIKALIHSTESGHLSVAEHATFTFEITGVSRALLAQATRHRIASFSVQSQRYVNMAEMPYVTPPKIADDEELAEDYDEIMGRIKGFYAKAVSRGIPKEDARFVTPQAACTQMAVTMNARELHHFFELRCCNRAQWEIRAMADEMLKLCKEVAPILFRNAGPACVRGKCPEGNKSCGKPRTNLSGGKRISV